MAEHFTLKNNLVFVLAEAAGGVYNSDQLRTLCEVADGEAAFLKITEDQRIGFMLDPNKLPEIQARVRKCGIILKSYKAAGVPSPRACLGELCTYSHQPSLGDALELTTHLLKSFPSPKRHSTIGINGCGRACLGSSTEDIHVVAEESGYKVSIGGKGSEIPQQAQLLVENVPRTDLPVVLEKLLALFYQESAEDERLLDVIERIGLTPFLNCLPKHLMPAIHDAAETSVLEENKECADTAEVTDAYSSGLVANDENLLIDDLIEQSSNEFQDGLVSIDQHVDILSVDEYKVNEPIVDIDVAHLDGEPAVNEAEGEDDLINEEHELLEDSEFEDGTLDDVSRIKDAIRTELSMNTANNEQITDKQIDLLDEIEQLPVIPAEHAEHLDSAEFEQKLPPEVTSDMLDSSLGKQQDSPLLAEQTESAAYHERSADDLGSTTTGPNRRRNSRATSAFDPEGLSTDVQSLPQVKGRLSIRFLEQQLAVELPSGMCFELPMNAVQEGSPFAMELPDGELIMERDGCTLHVKLGLLQMKFPIPIASTRRVA